MMHMLRQFGHPPAALLPATVRRILCLAAAGAAIGGAYYAGAVVGLFLKLPAATPSVLWPPNAILTSALLLTAVRWWPWVLLAALPAHIALEAGAGWPLSLVLALFATNCTEALIAAGGLRLLSDAPTRIDSLRRVGMFLLVVVFAAPFLSSFLDAAAVSGLGGEPYWRVWTARVFANALSALTVVPAAVMAVTSGWKWLTMAPRVQRLEAALLATCMFAIGVVTLLSPWPDPMTTALAERAALAWLLPFLLWAAIRLGPGGLSFGLLGSTLLLVSAALYSHGPFQGLSPADTTLALQIYLLVVSIPLLVVAALIEERRLGQQTVSNRLALEALLAGLSGRFVHVPSNRMHEVLSASLGQIGESLGLACLTLYEHTDSPRGLTRVAGWAAPGAGDDCAALARGESPDLVYRLIEDDESVVVEDGGGPDGVSLRDAPPAAAFTSRVTLPLIADGSLLGALDCTTTTPGATRASAVVEELRLVGRVLANVFARKRTEDSLRASEATKSAILSSLTYGVVVVDRKGKIVSVNERWLQMAGADGPEPAMLPGADYLEFCRSASHAGAVWPDGVVERIADVLGGSTPEFRLEYRLSRPDGDRTIAMRVVPLARPEGGAVVTHADLTDQRRAELEAQRAQAELAHVSRVATMGALTASIAHQLNQPLTGILSNAQAARRLLAAAPPDLAEAGLALDDIIADDRRASDVIVRMREFLRKDTGRLEDVDLNAVIGDVARLVSSDAIIRNVELKLKLDRRPALVRGERVQLEQAVLNLVVNALEAFGEPHRADRRVTVRSCCCSQELVEVSVVDNGCGFNGAEEFAFEALYTTKQAGMGLGLSIARSIVEAHAGAIRARDNAEGGATVSFLLPVAHHQTP
jgi:signal transduction histidine kinase/integral membrane sensor domain MASE1